MSDFQIPQYCMKCEQQTLHTKPTASHGLHLALTILTLGVWSIVWLIVAIGHGAKRPMCSFCGSQYTARQLANSSGFNVNAKSCKDKPAHMEPRS